MKKLFSLLTLALLTLSAWAGTTVTDVITASNLTATGTSYTDFSGVTITSNAVYAGQSAKSAEGAIQLRSKNSNSGIVSTASGGKLVSIKIEVASGTNTIDVYGNTTAYTNASNLYATGESNQGTKIGSLSETGTITVDGDYQYVGIRSNNGAVYISSIEITWESEGGVTPPDPTYTEVANLAAANALDSATVFKFKGDAVVTYQNGKYLYLRDGSGYGLIFNKSTNIQPTFTPGTVLAQDWTATKTNYQGYAEYIDYSTLSANGTNATLAEPQVITALDATLLNAYVKIEHVASIDATNKIATLTDGTTIALHTTFAALPSFENGDYYMTGIVSKYNGNLQLLLIDTDYEAPSTGDITTLAQANALNDATQFTFKGDAVVTYHNGRYMFLRDNSGYGLIYYTSAPSENMAGGTVLAKEWTATKTTYKDLVEYTGPANVTASGNTDATLAAVQTINASQMANMINAYVKIEHVASIDATNKIATLTDGTTINLFKRFNDCPLVEFSDADCSITGIVSIFDGTLQLYFISTDYVAPAGVDTPVISPNGGRFANQVEVTITCATEGAEIIYTINGGDEITYNAPFTLTETATIKAYAQTDDAESEMATAEFTIVPIEEATYALVTDVTTLADGDKIIIVSANEAGEAYAMASANKNYFNITAVNIAEDLTITTNQANVITLGAKDNNWTLQAFEGYLSASSSSSNYLIAKAEVDSNAIATIAISDTATASIIFQGNYTRNDLRYNASSTRFSCYGSTTTQAPVYIYKASAAAPEVKLGDVNKDGQVKIDDVTALIDALLSGDTQTETEHYSPVNANVNQDAGVTIADVTALIDLLLSGNAN